MDPGTRNLIVVVAVCAVAVVAIFIIELTDSKTTSQGNCGYTVDKADSQVAQAWSCFNDTKYPNITHNKVMDEIGNMEQMPYGRLSRMLQTFGLVIGLVFPLAIFFLMDYADDSEEEDKVIQFVEKAEKDYIEEQMKLNEAMPEGKAKEEDRKRIRFLESVEGDFTPMNLVNGRSYYGYGFWSDYLFYVKQNHPILGICFSHPLHPVSTGERLINFLCTTLVLYLFVGWSTRMCTYTSKGLISQSLSCLDTEPMSCICPLNVSTTTVYTGKLARARDKENGGRGVISCPCTEFTADEIAEINRVVSTYAGADSEKSGGGGRSQRRESTTKKVPPACKTDVPVKSIDTLCEPCNSAKWAAKTFQCEAKLNYLMATLVVCTLDAILYALAGCSCVMGIRKDDTTPAMFCCTRGWLRVHMEKLGHMLMAFLTGMSLVGFAFGIQNTPKRLIDAEFNENILVTFVISRLLSACYSIAPIGFGMFAFTWLRERATIMERDMDDFDMGGGGSFEMGNVKSPTPLQA